MIKTGWATRDITPDRPAMLQGQMYVRVADKSMDPLTLTAFAVDGGEETGEKLVLVSCDLCIVTEKLHDIVRDKISGRLPDLDGNSIILTATHTHTSLVVCETFYEQPDGDVMTADECVNWVADHIVEAVVEAWEKRVNSRVGNAYGFAVVGFNRRVVYKDGRALMYGSSNSPDFSHIEGSEDHGLDMVFVWSDKNELTGVILNIPCPSQVDQCRELFSADFWHEIREYLKLHLGSAIHVLSLCGAAGDQSPTCLTDRRAQVEMRRRRGLTLRQDIAVRVGNEVLRALQATYPSCEKPQISHLTKTITFPRRKISQVEYDWAKGQYEALIKKGVSLNNWECKQLRMLLESFEGDGLMPEKSAELHAIKLGSIAFVTNPFELFVDFGTKIKTRSVATHTFVVQLAGGTTLYLPTERAVQGGHYGAHPMVAPVGPDGGDVLVETSLDMIKELFS